MLPTKVPGSTAQLSLRNVEDLLHEGDVEISHEVVRCWWNRFGRASDVNCCLG
jgi:transposase-like protein